MKPPIQHLRFIIFIGIVVFTSGIHSAQAGNTQLMSQKAELYNYTFKVSHIDSYGYKPFIDFVETLFQKRPVYYPESGRFHNAEGIFEIIDSPVLVTELNLSTKLTEIGLALIQFNSNTVTKANHHTNE